MQMLATQVCCRACIMGHWKSGIRTDSELNTGPSLLASSHLRSAHKLSFTAYNDGTPVTMERTIKKVLVVLPSSQCQQILENYSEAGRYEFHWLTDPHSPTQNRTNDPTNFTTFDPIAYIDKAVKYVKENKIDAIFYIQDFPGLLAAIICEVTGLPGPSVESMFLCIHKYYSRMTEPSKLWFEAIELENSESKLQDLSIKYPCFVKPPCMYNTMGTYEVRNETEMKEALASCHNALPAWNAVWRPLFEKYIDTKKYPLALKDVALVEELVQDGTEHTVEGWVDDKSNYHIWLTSDQGFFMKPRKTLEGCYIPSQARKSIVKKMEAVALRVAENHGLRHTFFNIEMWCRNGGREITVTEINNRAYFVFHHLYYQVYGTSSCFAALHLACGEYEEVTKLCATKLHQQEGKGTLVGGQFYVQIHVHRERKAAEIINFEAARNLQEQALCSSELGLFVSHGSAINLKVDEHSILRPLGSSGYLTILFYVFKTTLHEVMIAGEEVRNRLVKVKDVLPYEREKEYYQDCCGLSL